MVVRGLVRRVVRGVVRRVVRGLESVGSPRSGGQFFQLSRHQSILNWANIAETICPEMLVFRK